MEQSIERPAVHPLHKNQDLCELLKGRRRYEMLFDVLFRFFQMACINRIGNQFPLSFPEAFQTAASAHNAHLIIEWV